ncbi:helix-turn-helix transcriptional regulator (plasmid) [Xanthomonas sp. CPBF 426]|uniref:helix-turn-helix domain-containing protein n=1 Tax=Xanthomonas TaxID=338 RepID=UPI0015C2A56F|nr:helix-turn-helix transcriptional regulator [Xanthomonas sp. CPBF 426]CAD1798215.1 helix-turn-helix transcriptional regulator [Xanthomonas sp. CPBF 426]
MESRPEDVGRRLQQLRQDKSQEEFAGVLGISRMDYAAYEAGKREIHASLLVTLLERCAIDPTWVLTGTRRGTLADDAAATATSFRAILEAAQRAGLTLTPEAFAYAITAAFPTAKRSGEIDSVQADVLVKLATLNGRK